MPDYPIDRDRDGLLPWSWAAERLAVSREYWVATVWPDGRPHVTAVWGLWHDGAVWFSCGPSSRKARNLTNDPRCVVTTADAREPVIVEGVAERMGSRADAEAFAVPYEAKYRIGQSADFFAANALFRVRPAKVLGMVEEAFTTSPTRWVAG